MSGDDDVEVIIVAERAGGGMLGSIKKPLCHILIHWTMQRRWIGRERAGEGINKRRRRGGWRIGDEETGWGQIRSRSRRTGGRRIGGGRPQSGAMRLGGG